MGVGASDDAPRCHRTASVFLYYSPRAAQCNQPRGMTRLDERYMRHRTRLVVSPEFSNGDWLHAPLTLICQRCYYPRSCSSERPVVKCAVSGSFISRWRMPDHSSLISGALRFEADVLHSLKLDYGYVAGRSCLHCLYSALHSLSIVDGCASSVPCRPGSTYVRACSNACASERFRVTGGSSIAISGA